LVVVNLQQIVALAWAQRADLCAEHRWPPPDCDDFTRLDDAIGYHSPAQYGIVNHPHALGFVG